MSNNALAKNNPDWYDPRYPDRREGEDLVWGGPGGRDKEIGAGYEALRIAQGRRPDERRNQTEGEEPHRLCRTCGWTSHHEMYSSYTPRLRILHTRHNLGLWDIGGKWVLRDQMNGKWAGNDVMTQKFLLAQPGHTIPVVPEILVLNEPNDLVELTLMRKVDGEVLYDLWYGLSATQRKGYIDQMAAIIRQLRQFTAPHPQKVDGSPLDDLIIGCCIINRAPSCHMIGPNADAWLDALAPTLRGGLSRLHKTNDPVIIEAKLLELRANFPSGGPYYLTHGDLSLTNILVKDNKIVALLDWETAGYYPWWAERWFSGRGHYSPPEFNNPMWALIEPELTWPDFNREHVAGVYAVVKAYGNCNVNHPGKDDCWYRPAFSASEPAASTIKWRYCANELKHEVSDIQFGAKRPTFPLNGANE